MSYNHIEPKSINNHDSKLYIIYYANTPKF